MKWLSIALIIIGLFIGIATFYPAAKLEITYKPNLAAEIIPVDTKLGIVIPKINANAKIIADVDPLESSTYQQALTQGVAHAKGTSIPGDQGNAFLFSHSSVNFFEAMKYNSVFYLLSKLEVGDPIYIYRNDQKLTFKVTEKKYVNSDAVSYLSSNDTKPTITLMTCWPPGTDMKRLIIQASPTK